LDLGLSVSGLSLQAGHPHSDDDGTACTHSEAACSKRETSKNGLHAGSGELPPADQIALGQHNGAPIKLVPSSAPPSNAPPQQLTEEATPQQAVPMSEPQLAPQVGEPQVTLRLAKPEEAEVIAKQVS
jgi:hypothetical protein